MSTPPPTSTPTQHQQQYELFMQKPLLSTSDIGFHAKCKNCNTEFVLDYAQCKAAATLTATRTQRQRIALLCHCNNIFAYVDRCRQKGCTYGKFTFGNKPAFCKQHYDQSKDKSHTFQSLKSQAQ